MFNCEYKIIVPTVVVIHFIFKSRRAKRCTALKMYNVKGKGKRHLITSHEGPDVE